MSEFICKNCQALLGVGNVYCLNCGTPVVASVETEQETVIRPTTPKTKVVVMPPIPSRTNIFFTWLAGAAGAAAVGGLILLIVAAVAYLGYYRPADRAFPTNSFANKAANTSPPTANLATPRPTFQIMNDVFRVEAGGWWSKPFTVPQSGGKVVGGFRVTDGGEKDIDMHLIEENEFANFEQGGSFRSFGGKIKTTTGKVNTDLAPGSYRVLFSNKHAVLTDKEVAAELKVEYY